MFLQDIVFKKVISHETNRNIIYRPYLLKKRKIIFNIKLNFKTISVIYFGYLKVIHDLLN